MYHIKEVVLVFLDVLVQRAYNFARRTSSDCIWRDVLIDYAACSDDNIITDSDAGKNNWPASNEAILSDFDLTVYDCLRILVRKITYDTSRSIMRYERTVEWYRSVISDSHQVWFWTEVCFSDYRDILA